MWITLIVNGPKCFRFGQRNNPFKSFAPLLSDHLPFIIYLPTIFEPPAYSILWVRTIWQRKISQRWRMLTSDGMISGAAGLETPKLPSMAWNPPAADVGQQCYGLKLINSSKTCIEPLQAVWQTSPLLQVRPLPRCLLAGKPFGMNSIKSGIS